MFRGIADEAAAHECSLRAVQAVVAAAPDSRVGSEFAVDHGRVGSAVADHATTIGISLIGDELAAVQNGVRVAPVGESATPSISHLLISDVSLESAAIESR